MGGVEDASPLSKKWGTPFPRVPAPLGNVTSAGWQVTLCDPIWHVSSRSGEAGYLRTAISVYFTTPPVMSDRLLWFQGADVRGEGKCPGHGGRSIDACVMKTTRSGGLSDTRVSRTGWLNYRPPTTYSARSLLSTPFADLPMQLWRKEDHPRRHSCQWWANLSRAKSCAREEIVSIWNVARNQLKDRPIYEILELLALLMCRDMCYL